MKSIKSFLCPISCLKEADIWIFEFVIIVPSEEYNSYLLCVGVQKLLFSKYTGVYAKVQESTNSIFAL